MNPDRARTKGATDDPRTRLTSTQALGGNGHGAYFYQQRRPLIPVAAVVAAIALAAPWVSKINRARYAEDIAAAAPNLVTAKAMVATAAVESGFRPSIERCECKAKECDGGLAHGIYQLHAFHFAGHTAAEVCADNRLSSVLAARMLWTLSQRVGGMEEALRVYVGVFVSRNDPRVKQREDLFELLMEVHPDV